MTGTIQKNMVLLWENQNPGTTTGAFNVALDLSEYPWIIIKARPYVSSPNIQSWLVEVNGEGNFSLGTTDGDGRFRRLGTATSTGVSFTTGTWNNGTSPSACVPCAIWGIRA